MDSLTHIVLGACVGEIFLGKKLGKKAMLLGAVAQSIPDVDFIAALWLKPADNVLAHRGFTHSILFAVLLSILLARIIGKWHAHQQPSRLQWGIFFITQLFIHLFLDAFNAYGVGWFEPFSHARVSFNVLFVADPFFSLWTGIAFLILLFASRHYPRRQLWAKTALVISSLYLLYAVMNKLKIDTEVRKELAVQQISYTHYFTTPTPFNNWLWYAVAGNDTGYYVGYRSVFDKNKSIRFTYFPKNDSLLKIVQNDPAVEKLTRFSKQFYTIENWNDTLVFNDLRFGQVIGWQDPHERFVFHYFLNQPEDNKLVMQRGRFEKWDRNSVRSLLRRIKGR